MKQRPDIVIIMTDEERAAPPYEADELTTWRSDTLAASHWFGENGVTFNRHYTGSLACVPSRPTIFTGQYPDVHGVTQTDGLGKMANDSRMRWLPAGEVPTLGHWFQAAGYDTHYDGKWHISHADLGDPITGGPLATNNSAGVVDEKAVQAYLDANPLEPYGFSGWVGPEPHGAQLANSGFRRDPIIAARVVTWLKDRYKRRRAGDEDAQRPFLLVASFVNPHDIVLWPLWARRGLPFPDAQKKNDLPRSPHNPPPVAAAPTANEDLATKPAAQIAYRASYPTGYGPPAAVNRAYNKRAQEYRDLYYRLHAEVDVPIGQVRRAVTEDGSDTAVIVRTSDHGELLGAHGGLHQKWFNLYEEATRVPFSIVRVGEKSAQPLVVDDAPTSHVDILPTLLAAAGIDEELTANKLALSFSEVHALPGRNLMPVVDGEQVADRDRPVYLMTRDNMLEGDTGASAVARRKGKIDNPPIFLRIQVPAHVGSNFEGLIARVSTDLGGEDHLWKLVRTFDDPATWTEPHERHLAANGIAGASYRTERLPDQWELYDLSDDPNEAQNRWLDEAARRVFAHLQQALTDERSRCLPVRSNPWPYVSRLGRSG
ncbi:MAG: sulfatase-like hydrolase/transferase [Acidimicrobiales bacterium]